MEFDKIKELMKEFEESNIHKLEVEHGEFKIKMSKEEKQYIDAAVAPLREVRVPSEDKLVVEREEKNEVVEGCKISAPLVGTFYSASSPDTAPFVKVGDFVKTGQVVCIIEAMKVMNEIVAPHDGVIVEILVNNEDMVEFDQTLMLLK